MTNTRDYPLKDCEIKNVHVDKYGRMRADVTCPYCGHIIESAVLREHYTCVKGRTTAKLHKWRISKDLFQALDRQARKIQSLRREAMKAEREARKIEGSTVDSEGIMG